MLLGLMVGWMVVVSVAQSQGHHGSFLKFTSPETRPSPSLPIPAPHPLVPGLRLPLPTSETRTKRPNPSLTLQTPYIDLPWKPNANQPYPDTGYITKRSYFDSGYTTDQSHFNSLRKSRQSYPGLPPGTTKPSRDLGIPTSQSYLQRIIPDQSYRVLKPKTIPQSSSAIPTVNKQTYFHLDQHPDSSSVPSSPASRPDLGPLTASAPPSPGSRPYLGLLTASAPPSPGSRPYLWPLTASVPPSPGSRPDLGPLTASAPPSTGSRPDLGPLTASANQQSPVSLPTGSQTYSHSSNPTDQSLASFKPFPHTVPESDSRSTTNQSHTDMENANDQSHIDQLSKNDQPSSGWPPGGAQTYFDSRVPARPPLASSRSSGSTHTAPQVPPAGSPYSNLQQNNRKRNTDVEAFSSSKSNARVDVISKTIVQVFTDKDKEKEMCVDWCLSDAGDFVCCPPNPI